MVNIATYGSLLCCIFPFCILYLTLCIKNSKNFLYIKSLIYFCIYLNDIYLDMSLTTIVSNVFKPRQKELEKYVYDAEHLQHKVLMHLINKGKILNMVSSIY